MLSVKRLVRAFAFVAEHQAAVTGEPVLVRIPAIVVDRLRRLLQHHHATTVGIAGRDDFYALCVEIDAALLAPTRDD